MMYVHMTETTTLQMHESMCSLLESRESNINSLATELNSTETNSTTNRLSTGVWSYLQNLCTIEAEEVLLSIVDLHSVHSW